MSNTPGDFYAFGSYRLDTASRTLTRSGAAVAVPPKAFDLLVLLAESGGRLLSRQELMDALWRDTVVEEVNLSFQVSTLRKALGEEGSAWIEAAPKHGYRFKAPVERVATERLEPDILAPSVERVVARTGSYSWRIWVVIAIAGAITIGATFVPWRRWTTDRRKGAGAALSAFPATTYPGRETHPSFSPDGSQIVFAWEGENGNNFDIYVKVVGENRALRLTSDPRPEFGPVWSPDGRRIAFCRDGEAGSEIVLIPALGGPEQILATLSKQVDPERPERLFSRSPGIGYPNAQLAWFPDGLSLAAVARNDPRGPNRIMVLSVDERRMQPITSPPERGWGDDSPAVSPDGHRLAFTRSLTEYPQPAYVYVEALSDQKAASGKPKRITAQDVAVAGLAWTSDSRRLLFRSMRSLWTVGADHGTPEPLSLPGFNPSYPAISSKGERLAFVDAAQDLDIWRIDGPLAKGRLYDAPAAPTRLISSTRFDTNPQYSPDGRRIAFTSFRGGTVQIWICDSDGSNTIQLTNVGGETGTPRWSPDGQYITFDSMKSGTGDVYVISAQGGPVHRVTPESSHEDIASWSRDGKWIYFESDRSGVFEIWKTPFAGGKAVQVTNNGGAEAFESYDGRYVYYAKWGQHGTWRRPVEGGQETRVLKEGSPFHWGLYEKGACLVDLAAAAGATIKCLDFGSSRVTTVCTLPKSVRVNGGGPSFAVSADGRSILYVGIERQESDIMVVDNFR